MIFKIEAHKQAGKQTNVRFNLYFEYRERYPALNHFAFSNFLKLFIAEIKKNKNNGLKEW